MGDDRHFRELERLRRAVGPALCVDPAPCVVATASEVRIMPGGHEVRTGAEPRPLCEGCPNSEARAVRHVDVRLDYRNRHGYEIAPSAASIAHSGPDEGPGEHGAPKATDVPTASEPEQGAGLPVSWPPDHPARLALEGREPPPPRRRHGDAGAINKLEEFGL